MRFVYLPRIAAPVALALTVAACNGSGSGTLKSPKHLTPLSADTYVELEKKEMRKEDPILLRIYKQESKLEVWKKRQKDGRYALFKSYEICRWSGKLGPKVKEGDKQAPEGFYTISPGQMNPKSSYYLSFNMGFPNSFDRAHGRTGLHLMVHGACSSAGCYSMTDQNIAEIYALARESFNGGQAGFQVQAMPFRMTPENLARHRDNPNMSFWKNLKEGTDSFEVTRQEPKVEVCGKRYVFNAMPSDPFSQFDAAGACPAYEVPPEIGSAVAAKARADEIRIAALSGEVPAAPIDVGQNGPLTPAAPVMVAQSPAPAAKGGSTLAFAPMPQPKPGVSREPVQVASVDGAAVPLSGVPSKLARWFGLGDEEPAKEQTGSVQKIVAPPPAAAAPAAPIAAAPIATPRPVPAPRQVAAAPKPAPAPRAVETPSVQAEAAEPPKPLLKRVTPEWAAPAAPPPPPAAVAVPAPVPSAASKARVNSAFSAFN